MHKYYKDNALKLREFMDESLVYISDDIERIFKKTFNEALDEIWAFYYNEILEVLPYIGGDKVSGTFNLTGATEQIAFGVVGKRYGLTTEEWGKLIQRATEMYFKNQSGKWKLIKYALKFPKLVNVVMKKSVEKNRKNATENPGSFEMDLIEPTEEFPLIMHYRVCPIHEFAKKHGYMEYMPYLCNLDYTLFKFFGASLYREKTRADGDEYCDFKIKKDASFPDVWPPHVLDKEDPLK